MPTSVVSVEQPAEFFVPARRQDFDVIIAVEHVLCFGPSKEHVDGSCVAEVRFVPDRNELFRIYSTEVSGITRRVSASSSLGL